MSVPASIRLNGEQREAAAVRQDVRTAFDQILSRGVFRWGPEVAGLELELAAFFRCSDAVAVSSGGVALTIALLALGVGNGDEVVMVPNVDVSISAPVVHTGASVVWCDIDEATFNLDAGALERVISSRTRAVVLVHLFGNPVNVDAIRNVVERHNVPIVEDATHAPGASWKGEPCGSLGQIGILGLSSGKPLGAAGTAGVILTRDPDLAREARTLASYGMHPADLRDFHDGVAGTRFRCLANGFNASLDEWQSAVIRAKLKRLPRWIERRREQAEIYRRAFADVPSVHPQACPAGGRSVPRQFAVRVRDRDHVLRQLVDRGITPGIGYSPPLHVQPLYRDGNSASSCPGAECVDRELLTLPVSPYLRKTNIEFVADSLAAIALAPRIARPSQ